MRCSALRSGALLCAMALLSCQSSAETVDGKSFSITMEDNVIVLDDDNFDEALKLYDVMVVEFYAPWCGYCKKLAPEYAKVAKTCKGDDLPIGIAKCDVIKNERIGERYKVESFPTIKIFTDHEREPKLDKVKPDPAEILKVAREWREQTDLSLPFPEVSTAAEVKEMQRESQVVILGVFDSVESEQYRTFAKVGTSNSYRTFAKFATMVGKADQAKKLAVGENSVTIFKAFDQKRQTVPAPYTLHPDMLEEYILINSRELVCDFTHSKTDCTSREASPHVVGFYKKGHHKRFEAEYLKAAVQMRRSKKPLQFTWIDPGHPALDSFFEVYAEEVPTIMFLEKGGFYKAGSTKFHIDKKDYPKLGQKQIVELADKYLKGELKASGLSQKSKWKETATVKQIVSADWNDKILNSQDTDAMVMFYAPWCAMCKQIKPYYQELGNVFKKVDSVLIAKMDATENDIYHKEVSIEGYPTVYWFKSDRYPKVPNNTDVWTQMDINQLKQFVLENAAVSIDESQLQEPDKKMLEEAKAKQADSEKMKPDAKGASAAEVDDSDMDLKVITRANFQTRVLDSDEPAFVEFYAPWCGHCKTLMPKMEALGKKKKESGEKVLIGKCDMTANDMDEWSLPMNGFPTLIFFPAEDKSQYKLYEGPRYVEDFQEFMKEGYKKGGGGKEIKSADPVDDSSDPVKVIVGSSFHERVMKSEQPVLLKMYAPWCGACKALAPHYEAVAKEYGEKVLVAKIDMTANDVDHDKVSVSGYPLVMFFPSDDKKNPMKYEGERDTESLSKFVAEQLAEEEEEVGEDEL